MIQTNLQTITESGIVGGGMLGLFEKQLKKHIRDYYNLQTENGKIGYQTTLKPHLLVIAQLIQNDEIDLTTQTLKSSCNPKNYKPTATCIAGKLKAVTTWMKDERRAEYDKIFNQIQQMQRELHQLQQAQRESRVENRQLHQETRDATMHQLQQQQQQQQRQYSEMIKQQQKHHIEMKEFRSEILHEIREIKSQISGIDTRLRSVETSNISFHEIVQNDDMVGDDMVGDDMVGDDITTVPIDEIVKDE